MSDTDVQSQTAVLKMDLNALQALERESVLDVLRRDKQLRAIEEARIR